MQKRVPARVAGIHSMKSSALHFSGLRALFCMVVISLSAHAHAQTPTAKLRFVSFPMAANPAPIELLIGKGETMKVELPTNSISDAYTVPALATWALGKSAVDKDGKFVFKSFGTGKSIGAKDQIILVIRKGKDDSEGLELIALEDGDLGFGGGKYLLMNLSEADVAGSIGTSKFSIAPNKHIILAPEPTSEKGERSYCFAKAFFRVGDDIQPFFSSTWRFNEKARTMVFFYHDPKTKHLRIHTIRGFVK